MKIETHSFFGTRAFNSMNHRRGIVASVLLVSFTLCVVAWQCSPDNAEKFAEQSLVATFIRGHRMAMTPEISHRDGLGAPANKWCRLLDQEMPENARVFITGMLGPTNYNRIGNYFFATYYLFPRQVDVSLDGPTHLTPDGLTGKTSGSDQELLAHGYDVRLDNQPDGSLTATQLHPLDIKQPSNPAWFASTSDLVIAFLLPLVTALAGMWPLRFLAPDLMGRMALFDRLACSFGLGMMIVAAITLGVKLCGFSGYGLILALTYLAAFAEIWRHTKRCPFQFKKGYLKTMRSPGKLILLPIGLLAFAVLFREAAVAGLRDPDSLRWMLKAKIMHLCAGSEIIHWFSNPGFSYAHLDYPTLVPSLHAATYDSLGHVDEFVTKFWPVWMLFFLVTALASQVRDSKKHFSLPLLAPLCLLLLPDIQQYVQWEGSTMPMIFFITLGGMQCCLWMVNQDRNRLVLGLALLFGAAMTTYQGFIILALAVGLLLPFPSLRWPLLTSVASPQLWKMAAFCLLAALPFVVLRLQIPSLEYESGWASYAAHHFTATLTAWPRIVLIELGRIFMDPSFIQWTGQNGHFVWTGKWDGPSSLYNHSTLGLAWVCLALTIILCFTMPARRAAALWISAIFLGTLLILCVIFASFVDVVGLDVSIKYTNEGGAGRYLFPLLTAWFAIMILLFFGKTVSTPVEIRAMSNGQKPAGPATANP